MKTRARRSRGQVIFGLPAVFGPLFFTFAFAGCKAAVPGAAEAPEAGAADQLITNFTIDSFVAGQKKWTLVSPRADVFEKENRIEVEKPEVLFFDDGQPGSRMNAGRGRLFSQSKDMRAWDNVVLVSTDGARLESEWLVYMSSADLITSTAPVAITRQGSVIHGEGWQAPSNLSEIAVFQQRAEIAAADDPLTKRRKP